MLTYNDLIVGLEKLGPFRDRPVIAHASLSAFGQIQGGADSIVTGLSYAAPVFIMPTFTYKTMVTPLSGPANNAINYQQGQQWNKLSEVFHNDMPVDPLIGKVSERMRKWPEAARSMHPILSFSGFNAKKILEVQSIAEPFAPIRSLIEQDGWVLLLGVNHTANTSIHFAEKLAGRSQFLRWASTESGVVSCPGFPGCSSGFDSVSKEVKAFTKTASIGNAIVQAIPLRPLMIKIIELIKKDRTALLCERSDCERCAVIRGN